jgi:hypothetical protein
MSYCRWSDGDVYVYSDVNDRKGEIRCCSCTLPFIAVRPGGVFETPYPSFIARGPKEMIEHLQEHVAVGHQVPTHAFTRLAEAAKAKPPKHPVHFAVNKLENRKGEIINAIAPLPICGYNHNAHFRKLLGIRKSENGHAHPRDIITKAKKQVTCPECKRLTKLGLIATFQKKPTPTSRKSKTR